ncbi:MAG: hypothetical protein KMY53_16300 [Desulfarculus sp.]|nr:hypothetical protein [Pseudomonadota bacterium]MBV1718387.1 hypothetical protein [Desulfarculus sp.]MBU4576108.1 hypothetical protein [Pseudomonadota bacterium]MBU4599421.1 hypothetical protein [Pseudomonadota bacterium]MBV1739729.1 hypothetical protein [Desulfarculus sp.]
MANLGKEPSCATCTMKRYAEKKPSSIWAKLWRWHTGWCPGYKRYQAWLAAQGK